MKKGILLVCAVSFPLLGMDSPTREPKQYRIRMSIIRPTIEQRVQLTENQLKLINSELKTEIATFE